jgi:DNA integrity scanning protein DisA with diadenylate cyclase activity
MNPIESAITQAIIDEDHGMLSWIMATLPFAGEEFCETHGKVVLSNNATSYICKGFVDVAEAMREAFEKLSDRRLADSINEFEETLVKVVPFRGVKGESSNPIVKKHVIAENQADLDKEREQGSQPIEIEVETPKGKSVFIENTSKHDLQNPARIDIDEEASNADSMQTGGSDSHR